ncbi:MAG: cyclically-permuted mutarotase family protein [Fusobacterium sp.]|nr:cyclically-permuted mutarotase family protein [Fusobacterium sp.]
MKKFLFGIFVLAALAGCTSSDIRKPQADIKTVWECAGELPAQKGYEKNIGTAGILYGLLEERYIVTGGGANFPHKSVLEGGAKQMYSDLWLIDTKSENKIIEHINLPVEIGYGASVTTEKGIYYIGGSSNQQADDDILFLTLDENKNLKYEKIGELPFTFQSGAAVEYNGKLYIVGGKQNGTPSNKVYEYNLTNKVIKELPSVPAGRGRTQSVAQILNDSLYVFSGGDTTAYTDGYKYNFETGKWEEISPVRVNGKEISLLGAASVKLNKKEMLVIGGFNKEIYDDAVKKLGTLRGQELLKFKASYFGADPDDFRWNRDILIYNSETNSWRSIGEIPFNAPCGEGLVIVKNKIYSINGEIKPGVRTPRIYQGEFIKK